MNENRKTTGTPLYYPRKMRRGWCVAHEVTAAGVTIERYGIRCQTYAEAFGRAEVMNREQADALQPAAPTARKGVNDHERKVSTITLRLTAEEAAQLEILKDIIGKKSGSEAIKYVVKEYPDSVRITSRKPANTGN